MLFRQILHEDLGCASYVIADGGEAAVVDPKWQIEDYLELAHEHDFQIRHVLETHNHADHLSGRGRLAAATGATLYVSAEAGAEYDHQPLAAGRARELLDAGATLVDGREPREFDAVHVSGSISVTQAQSGVGTRAAWVLEPEADVVVLAASDDDAGTLARDLEAVGFRSLRGFVAGGIAAWQAADLPTASTPAIDPEGLAERLRTGDVALLDVREDDEWEEGHVADSVHVPYHELRDGLPPGLPREKPLAVACSAGNRSSLAASLLRRAGVERVVHVADGGVEDLERLGIELVRD